MIDALPPFLLPSHAPRQQPRQAGDDRFRQFVESDTPRVLPNGRNSEGPAAVTEQPLPPVQVAHLPNEAGAVPAPPVAIEGPPTPAVAAHQVGAVDIIERPWTLQGGWGLSYRDVLGASFDADGASPAQAASVDFAGVAAAIAASRDLSLGDVARTWRFAPVADVASLALRDRTTRAAGQGSEATAPTRFAALLTWPERMLRWQQDASGERTAWVRDYTLDPVDVQRLCDALRCEAGQDGRPLHRIMLNGHAVWRASDHT